MALTEDESAKPKNESDTEVVCHGTAEMNDIEYGSVRLLASPQETENERVIVAHRSYKRRWFMLFLFGAYSFSNAFQWIHLNIIGDVLLKFYNASLPSSPYQKNMAIDWLSMIYMLSYIPLILPSTWLLDKKGLRFVCIIGSLLNALGAWLKCVSASQDRFAVLMFAQTICGVSQIFILGIPTRLAAVWFGPKEVSTATSIGVFGNQVGVSVGFLLPPEMVSISDDLTKIRYDLAVMYYVTAGFTTAIFLLILFVFQKKPPNPPSQAQHVAVQMASNAQYIDSLGKLFRNRGFILLMLTYGLNTGSYYAISTLMNPIVLTHFPDEHKNAGRIGLTMVVMGIIGAIAAGVWLDRTKTFKGTTVGIYFMSMCSMAALTATSHLGHIWILFVTAGSLGLFMTGYLPVGFEFAAEITFPEPEGTSSGLLNASAQIFGIALTMGMRAFLNEVSPLAANITLTLTLLCGVTLTAFISADYRRQKAGNMSINIEEPGNDLLADQSQNVKL